MQGRKARYTVWKCVRDPASRAIRATCTIAPRILMYTRNQGLAAIISFLTQRPSTRLLSLVSNLEGVVYLSNVVRLHQHVLAGFVFSAEVYNSGTRVLVPAPVTRKRGSEARRGIVELMDMCIHDCPDGLSSFVDLTLLKVVSSLK